MTDIKKHWLYLKYVLRHKWYVLIECWSMGIIWQGIVHDLSKFRTDEWAAYCRRYVGANDYKTALDDPRYQMAWHLHQKRNCHHWQWWLTPKDGGGFRVLPMSISARAEMLCDWRAMSRQHGTNVANWYRDNATEMSFHGETRQWIERELYHD